LPAQFFKTVTPPPACRRFIISFSYFSFDFFLIAVRAFSLRCRFFFDARRFHFYAIIFIDALSFRLLPAPPLMMFLPLLLCRYTAALFYLPLRHRRQRGSYACNSAAR